MKKTQLYLAEEGDIQVTFSTQYSRYDLHQLMGDIWEWVLAVKYPGYVNQWLENNGYKRMALIPGKDVPQGFYRTIDRIAQQEEEEEQEEDAT